jgi:hypothetical protein
LIIEQPFDINLGFQNREKANSEQSVDIRVTPEVRGVLDKTKLSRLLYSLSLISSMMAGSPSNANPPKSESIPLKSPFQDRPRPFKDGGLLRPDSFANLQIPSTPLIPLTPAPVDDSEIIELLGTLTPDKGASPNTEILAGDDDDLYNTDPVRVDNLISVVVPVIALDLTYDVGAKNHLVFAAENMVIMMKTRAFDSQLAFELGSLHIRDSLRCKEQCDLAYSPLEGDNRLVRITYISIRHQLSPLFRGYATEIDANFARLLLNTDVNTISHLKPFFAVLLGKNTAECNDGLRSAGSAPGSERNISPLKPSTSAGGPVGMLVKFRMEHMSLELLRHANNYNGSVKLQSAFLLQITGLNGNIDMQTLMKAGVAIRAIEIVDTREVSRGYAFKKVFCPVADLESGSSPAKLNPVMTVVTPGKGVNALGFQTPVKASTEPVTPGQESQHDLLTILYSQESKDVSFVSVTVKNMTSFVALDTVLDLADVASANAFAFLNLLQPDVNTAKSASSAFITEDGINRMTTPLEGTLNGGISEVCAGISDTTDGRKSPKVKSYSTMTVNVKIISPRIVLLDDPSTEQSRAVVCRGYIELIHTRDNRLLSDTSAELQESIHATIKELEMFVILNMTHWHPLPLVEPFGTDFHMKRHQINEKLVSSSISLDIDDITARLSINDIVLAQSILTRRSLTEATVPTVDSNAMTVTDSTRDADAACDELKPQPLMSMTICLGTISFVAINDFNGQNIPVIRVQLEEAKYVVESQTDSQQVGGEASFALSADFYNAKISVWEPILEVWRPNFVSLAAGQSVHYEIFSENDLQLTLTSTFLETILHTYTQLLQCEDVFEREKVPDVVVNNLLGVHCELKDTVSGDEIASMDDYQSVVLPARFNLVKSLSSGSSNSIYETNKRFGAVDLVIFDVFGAARQPIRRLPFVVNKPKVYSVFSSELPMQSLQSTFLVDKSHHRGSFVDSKQLLTDPIIEEAYEFSRYDPLTQQWRSPFLMNDPYEWSDAGGTHRRNIRDIALDERGWQWADAWSVDMDGEAGVEIDADGWSYATSFNAFTTISNDRVMRPMDTVRRRRWIRAKIPTVPASVERLKPMRIVWDVQSLKNGALKVDIRSDFQVIYGSYKGALLTLLRVDY